jgi:hypothetical protein
MGKLIESDGKISELNSPTLEQMQNAVGGYIEVIPCSYESYVYCIVNEEGIIKNLNPNMVASRLLDRPIVGPALFLLSGEMN